MGSISLTAVNAFSDPGAARQASAHLASRGYPMVAAGLLEEIALRNGLLAVVGAGIDHERMLALSGRLHDRIAALAVIGGPLAIMLGRHEGLTMPMLVVSDRVGRRDRRHATRRLPRGSMLVRAANFDAALEAVVSFLDRTTEGVAVPAGGSNLRPLVLRLAPAALFAPAAAAMLAGSGADAAGSCTPEVQDNGLVSITCDGEGAQLTVGTNSDGAILVDGELVAFLSDTQKISIVMTGGDDQLTIDESAVKFTTGPDHTPVVFDVDMGEGVDSLKWMGSPESDAFKVTADAIDVPGGTDFENKVRGVDVLQFDLGAGDDTFDGGTWPFKIELDGGAGKDSLIGGLGPDVFKVSPGGDAIDGGQGFDLVKIATDDKLLKITDASIEFADSENVVGYKATEALDFLGGDGPNAVEIDGTKLSKLDFDGGAGENSIKLTTDDGLVKIGDSAISLNFTKTEIGYKDFSEFGLADKATPLRVEIGDTKLTKLDLAGGDAAGNSVKLTSGASLVQLSEDLVKLTDVAGAEREIKFAGFDTFSYLGDAACCIKLEVDDTKFTKLDVVGGDGGGNSIKLTSALPAVQLTGEFIKLSNADTQVAEIKYAGFDTFNYLGDGSVNKVDIGADSKFTKLDLDGGGGADSVKLTSGAAEVDVSGGDIKLSGADGEQSGAIGSKGFDSLSYMGDGGSNKVDIGADSKFTKLDLDGGGGADSVKLTSGAAEVDVSGGDIKLSGADGEQSGAIGSKGFDSLSYMGDGGSNKVDIGADSKFTKLDLDGGGGGDDKLDVAADGLVKIGDSAISLDFTKTEIGYKGFSEFGLVVADKESPLAVEVGGFSFDKMDLAGGDGAGHSIKLTSGASLVQLSEDLVKLTDSAGGEREIKFAGFDTFGYLGDAACCIKLEINDTKFTKLDVDGGAAAENSIKLTSGASLVQLSEDLVKLTDAAGAEASQIKFAGFDTFDYLGDGSVNKVDVFDTKFAKLHLDGGGGNDKLDVAADGLVKIGDSAISLDFTKTEIGYKGFSEFGLVVADKESPLAVELGDTRFVKMDLAGDGSVSNSIKLTSAVPLVQLSEDLVKLTDVAGAEREIKFAGFDTFHYLGDAVCCIKLEVDDTKFTKLDVVGGDGGGNSIKLTSALPAVQLTGEFIKLSNADTQVAEIKFAGFDTFNYLGDGSVHKVDVVGTKFAKLFLDAGDGVGSKLDVAADGLVKIGDSAISLNFSKIEIAYKDFSDLGLVGGAGDSNVDISDFSSLSKLSLDGGGGVDSLKLGTSKSLVKITDSTIVVGALNPIAQKGFESLSVVALTDVANVFDGSRVTNLKLTLDGGSKDDVLLGGALDDVITGGLGNNAISGGGGNDTLVETRDGSFVASTNLLLGSGVDALSSIEALKLTGGAGDNLIDTQLFKGPVTLDGGGGNDLLTSGAGADVLIGGAGNDALNGSQGNDRLLGGEGNDLLNGGPGTDFGDGGPGIDTGRNIETQLNIER